MKQTLLTICFIIMSIYIGHAQNQIIVGQTSGINIHYIDLEPDSSVLLWNTSDTFLLDIDNDAINDLAFIVSGDYDPQYYTEFKSYVKTINNKVKIISDDDTNYHLINKLNIGDTISEDQSWSNTSALCFSVKHESYWPPPGSTSYYGELGNGYFGFKIEYPGETFYGWIYIEATYDSIVVKELAIFGVTVGFQGSIETPKSITIFPNPCTDELTLKSTILPNELINYDIINCYGQIVKAGNIYNETFTIKTSALEPGFYILRARQGKEDIQRLTFIKKSN